MTITQILNIVRNKILESTEEIISNDTLLLYANLTQDDIERRLFLNNKIKSTTVNFTNGVGSLPTDFGTMYGDAFQSVDNYFPELSIDDFEKQTLDQAITIEGGQIKVYPTDTASLTIKYYPTYADITLNSTPAIDSYFHEGLVYGILYRTYEDLQDETLSQFYTNKYENLVNQRISIMSSYEETNQRGSQLFNEQNLII